MSAPGGPSPSIPLGLAGVLVLVGCGASPDGMEVLERADLQELHEAALAREAEPLVAALGDDADPARRRIAAQGLASVQAPGARGALEAALGDGDARVRGAAAFALGQLGTGEVAPALLAAFDAEPDPDVRILQAEALGKSGDALAVRGLAERIPTSGAAADDAYGFALGFHHAARRGLVPREAGGFLLELVAGADPVAAETAASALAAAPEPGEWGVGAGDLRAVLAGGRATRAAGGPLLEILARGGATEDVELIRQRLGWAEHWRERVAAARALGAHPGSTVAPAAVEALQRALEDPVHHVAETAARALVRTRDRERTVDRARHGAGATRGLDPAGWADRIRSGGLRPTVAAELLPGLVGGPHEGLVVDWGRGSLDGDRALAFPALAGVGDRAADSVLADALVGERRTAYAAASALADRIEAGATVSGTLLETLPTRTVEAMSAWGPAAPMSDARGLVRLVEALREHAPGAAGEAVAAAARHPHPALRSAFEPAVPGEEAGATPLADDDGPRRIDWELLAAGGPRPELEIVTARGAFVVELHPKVAPLAASSLMAWASEGRFDGLTFHRVEPDFILQTGDMENPAGHGGPSRHLRSEFSQERFLPGTLGMASAGKDTEGSQFFITHGVAPSLNGRYGAVGRVVSGLDVAERVARGDPVASVAPRGWSPPEGGSEEGGP